MITTSGDRAPLIENNPFFILGITPRDSSKRIIEAANDKSLFLDPEVCTSLRATLTHPRNRISAEVTWLPGLSPSKAAGAIACLRSQPSTILDRVGDPALVQANLLASALDLLDANVSANEWCSWICKLAEASGSITTEEVLQHINEDRIAANFPQVASSNSLDSEIAKRKQEFRDCILRCLDRLHSKKLVEVLTLAVQQTTCGGRNHAPALLDLLVDSYELEATKYLRQETENIIRLITSVRIAAKDKWPDLSAMIERLQKLMQNWDELAQPIQLSMKSRGLTHDMSRELASEIRNLSVDLVNDHGRIDIAGKLLISLKEVFAEVPELMHRFEDDARTLDELLEQKAQSEREQEEWRSKIKFSAEIGTVFKSTLSLSSDGILWKHQLYPLDSISRVRWGATRHSVNGIPTGTTYHIWFGDARNLATVETRQQEIFETFTQKLWQAVCARILVQQVTKLTNGERISFSDAVIHNDGVEMSRKKIFGSGERVSVSWLDVRIWAQSGSLYLGSTKDQKVYSELSYQNVDNVHILEALIRTFFEKGGRRLSDVFGTQ